MFIKICGVQSDLDVAASVWAGADAIGFVFAASPRRISPESAIILAAYVPPPILKVAVFRKIDRSAIELACHVGVDAVQGVADFHEPHITSLPLANIALPWSPTHATPTLPRLLPVVHDGPDLHDVLERIRIQIGYHSPVIVDGPASGSGQRTDWRRCSGVAAEGPIILAGGLSPDNVGQAIAEIKPFGVDVSSGVERTRGCKDQSLIVRFIKNVRSVEPCTPNNSRGLRTMDIAR